MKLLAKAGCPNERRHRARFHHESVSAELVGMGVLVWTLAETGLGKWTIACWLLTVILMLWSKGLQVWWRFRDSSARNAS